MIDGSGSVPLTNRVRIRIQEAQKHMDPTNPDQQHCYGVCIRTVSWDFYDFLTFLEKSKPNYEPLPNFLKLASIIIIFLVFYERAKPRIVPITSYW